MKPGWFLKAVPVVVVIYLLLPTLIVVASSFSAGAQMQFPPRGVTLSWYSTMFTSGEVWRTLWNSVYVALVASALDVLVAVPAMLALHKYRVRGRILITGILSLGFTTPFIVSALAFLLIFLEVGLIEHLTMLGVALGIVMLPFMLWAVASSIIDHDPELEQAAATLGAEEVQQFLLVTVPSLAPGIITGTLMVFVLTITEFLISVILVNLNNLVLPVYVYSGLRVTVSPFLAAVSILFIVVALTAFMLVLRFGRMERFLYRRGF